MSALIQPNPILSGLSDEQLLEGVREHGSQRAYAAALGVPESTLKGLMRRRALNPGRAPAVKPAGLRLTRADVEQAMLPANNCAVKRFRDTLDAEAQDALDYALAQDRRDLPAVRVRQLIVDALVADGMSETDAEREAPGVDAVNTHRSGQRPCRCKG